MYIDFIDLPSVPEELLESITQIMTKPTIVILSYEGKPVSIESIQRKKVSDQLNEWLQSVCNFSVVSQYLLLNSNSPIHRDPRIRPRAYNYLLDTGGSNVITTVYDNDQTILKSMVIPSKTWYCLETGRLHGVQGIEPGRWRIVLSINIKD
jgi:hypothetical protein